MSADISQRTSVFESLNLDFVSSCNKTTNDITPHNPIELERAYAAVTIASSPTDRDPEGFLTDEPTSVCKIVSYFVV